MASPSTERMIAKNKPEPEKEQLPASSGILYHLNNAGLLEKAIAVQHARRKLGFTVSLSEIAAAPDMRMDPAWHEANKPVVISRLVAWEVLSEAQRNGLHLPAPHREKPQPEDL